jgi:hypothetical protein
MPLGLWKWRECESCSIRVRPFPSAARNTSTSTDTLLKAIDATFKNRETRVPAEEFEALTTNFVDAHRVQWNAFVRKMGENDLIDAFGTVVADLKVFALPALRALARGEKITQQWKAGSGWLVS